MPVFLNISEKEAINRGEGMETKGIHIFSLNTPCANHCRYCLLSWNGTTLGVETKRAIQYADSFYQWLKENRPEMKFTFYFGYSMYLYTQKDLYLLYKDRYIEEHNITIEDITDERFSGSIRY